MEPVSGYLVGTAAQVAAGCADGPKLTDRELEVLTMVCEALTDKVIARRLKVSPKTISTHLEHIYLKLEVRGDAQNARCAAMRAAFDLGLVPVPHRH